MPEEERTWKDKPIDAEMYNYIRSLEKNVAALEKELAEAHDTISFVLDGDGCCMGNNCANCPWFTRQPIPLRPDHKRDTSNEEEREE